VYLLTQGDSVASEQALLDVIPQAVFTQPGMAGSIYLISELFWVNHCAYKDLLCLYVDGTQKKKNPTDLLVMISPHFPICGKMRHQLLNHKLLKRTPVLTGVLAEQIHCRDRRVFLGCNTQPFLLSDALESGACPSIK